MQDDRNNFGRSLITGYMESENLIAKATESSFTGSPCVETVQVPWSLK